MSDPLRLPGFVNAHSHAFQRALRGKVEGGDFWAWRESMLDVARGLTPEHVREDYAETYREMRAAGYTAVGEFHYVGFAEAEAAVEAAREAGVELVLLLAAYGRGGLDRFRQASVADYLRQVEAIRDAGARVGLAPHSVRACPRDWLEEIGAYAERESLVLHVHADEQPREIEECLAEHGLRPIELLAETGCLGPRTHRRPRDACRFDRSSTSSPSTARAFASARRPRQTSATASRRSRASWSARFRSASARTPTSASTRSRSCASSRGRPGGRRSAAT